MKQFFQIVLLIAFVLALLLAQFALSYVFPYPISAIHVPTVIIVLYLLLRERRRIVWYMFGFFFLLELLAPSGIYGSLLIPGVLSTLLAYWCHRFFFTNLSLYTGILLGSITLISYRVLHLIYIFFATALAGTPSGIAFTFPIFGMEILMTEITILSSLFFFLKGKHVL